jgi:hypothetical protein
VQYKKIKLAGLVVAASVLGVGAMAWANNGHSSVDERLSGYQETPALSTSGSGEFKASISRNGDSVKWQLSFSGVETDVTQAHIHFENATNAGAIVVFLCTNLNNAPVGGPAVQACPSAGGSISGTFTADDISAGAAAQGIAAGEMAEFISALRQGHTYVNVHSVGHPAGEIRAQIADDGRGHD